MAQQPPPWLGPTIEGGGLLLGLYAAVRGGIAGFRSWLRRRERRRELQASRDFALQVLLDSARAARHFNSRADPDDLRIEAERHKTELDIARNRLWAAQGKPLSASPSGAPSPDSEDE